MSEHIVIGNDRFIMVPESLQKIGVQFDHNAETVTFDCPRYWDEHDLSTMTVYVNYMRPNESFGTHICDNVIVDSSDDAIIHFDWTISGHVTEFAGPLSFLVCIRDVDSNGDATTHWNSELSSQLYISSGMKCREAVLGRYPDIITQLLRRMDVVEDAADGVASNAKKAAESEANAAAHVATAERIASDVVEYVSAAAESATNARTSEVNAAASAVAAEESANSIGSAVEDAAEAAANAKNSAAEAAVSEANVKVSETNAMESASVASDQATRAVNSAAVASEKAAAASVSEANAKASEVNAAESASIASTAENNASASAIEASALVNVASSRATEASESATNAALSESNADNSALLARSWAVGGTGLRTDEAVNNAKYWCDNAQSIVGGDFATKDEAKGYADVAKNEAINYADTADIDCGTW